MGDSVFSCFAICVRERFRCMDRSRMVFVTLFKQDLFRRGGFRWRSGRPRAYERIFCNIASSL